MSVLQSAHSGKVGVSKETGLQAGGKRRSCPDRNGLVKDGGKDFSRQ